MDDRQQQQPDIEFFDDRAFRHLAEFAPDALIAHRDGLVLWANEAASRLMMYPSPDALAGRPVLDFVAPESLALVKARIVRMLSSGQPEPSQAETFLDARGGRIAVEVSASPLGKGVILVSMHDLRPRHQAEREHRSAESLARAFFDASTAAMGIARCGLHVEVNAAYARLFGFESPDELVGRPLLELLDPVEHPRVLETLGSTRGSATSSVHGRRRDGTSLLLDVHASSFADDDVQTTVVVMRDVTAQRQFEERLAESERVHRDLIRQVPVGVWEEDLSGVKGIIDELKTQGVTDLFGHLQSHPEDLARCIRQMKILSVNPAACSMVGAQDRTEVVENLHAIFIDEALRDVASKFSELARRGVAASERWVGTLSGGRRWVALRAALVEGHADWSRVLVTTSDMTEQRKARDDKASLLDQLRHAEKMEAIGRLAGGVAHDFNNLLTAMMSSAEVSLSEVTPGSPLHQSFALILEASMRARELVNQILTFGRKDQPRREALDVSEVTTEALPLIRASLPSSMHFEVTIAPRVGTVLADRMQLHQVVVTLCANAREAVNATGHITISLERVTSPGQPAQAKLCVVDDGPGMDEQTRQRIFEPYLTTARQGHGLGLAVVHGIVTGAGGHLEVKSSPGAGARFEAWFPLVEVEPLRPAGAPLDLAGTERVLLVDDEPMVRTAVRRLLESLGYRVTEAADGQAALELMRARSSEFDVVMSDQTMPRLSGLDLARALHAELPSMPFVLCTGFSDELDDGKAKELGVATVLHKPMARDEIACAMRRAVRAV